MTYRIYKKHLSQNQIKCIDEFDTLEEARKQLAGFFRYGMETYDSFELQSQAKIKLEDGKIIDFDEFCKLEEVSNYEYILESDSYDFDSHRYYIEEYSPTYQAFVDGCMIAECDSSANQFAEQVCYDAINDYMSKLNSSAYPIDTWIEADANEVDGSRSLWSYDFDKDEWIIE